MLRNPSSSSSSTSCLSSSSTSYYSSSVDSITCHFCSGRIPSVISFKYLTKKDFIRPRSFSPLRGKDSETLNQEQSSSTTDQSEQNYAQSQLELLEKLTSSRERGPEKGSIAEQLANKVSLDSEDAVVPLVKKVPTDYDDLTISQKRNIRRQKYLNQVSKRNDAPLFTAIALFVLLPPAIILGIAISTGYIDLLP